MKILSKHILFLVLASWMSLDLVAQDPRYSQYYSAPHRLNPALIGVFDGQYRVGLNYRSQWGGAVMSSAYNTYSVTGDMRIATFTEDYVGLGLEITGDKAGEAGYGQLAINAGASYHKKLSGGRSRYRSRSESYLIGGAQIGYGQRGVDLTKVTLPDSYQPEDGSFTPGLTGQETNLQPNTNYLNTSAGVLWYASLGERQSVYAGLGIQHLNRPDISFFDRNAENLYMRFSVHAGGEVLLGDPRTSPISLLPGAVLLAQGPSTELNIGTSFRYMRGRNDLIAFKIGAWARFANSLAIPVVEGQLVSPEEQTSQLSAESIVFHVGFDYNELSLGLSYDANVSSLASASNGFGAFEISLIYTNLGEFRRGQPCPAF